MQTNEMLGYLEFQTSLLQLSMATAEGEATIKNSSEASRYSSEATLPASQQTGADLSTGNFGRNEDLAKHDLTKKSPASASSPVNANSMTAGEAARRSNVEPPAPAPSQSLHNLQCSLQEIGEGVRQLQSLARQSKA